MPSVKTWSSGERVARRRKVSRVKKSRHHSHPRVTVCALPDHVLVEIFDFYLATAYRGYDAWHKLVHVCKTWRSVVFASPHRLQLQLLCTSRKPVQNTLDIWPALPIIIRGRRGMSKPQDSNNIIAALKQHSRVRKVQINDIPDRLMKKIRAMKMRDPFSALTSLELSSFHHNVPVLPDSFLGGSTPRLQSLDLSGIPFPALPKLLLSTSELVVLRLWRIPLSGYISPEAMATHLSTLTRLQTLSLGFQSPRSKQESRPPPRLKRVCLPALTSFRFKGDSEYLEDIVACIDTPLLDRLHITFFNQLILETPLLRHFISRVETLHALYRADLWFSDDDVKIRFFRKDGMDDQDILSSEISCRPSDWQLSSLAQVCDSALSPLDTLERLEIHNDRLRWQEDMENSQWLEVLHPFTSVKDLVLHWKFIQLVAPALEELAGERVTEVLSALQNIFLEGSQPSEPVKKSMGKFIAARQLSGCPVAVHHRESQWGSWQEVHWEVGE